VGRALCGGIFCLLLLGFATMSARSSDLNRADDEIARVNGVVITRREFQVAYRQAVDQHARDGHPVDEAHIAPVRRAVVERLVEEELLVQESRRRGIEVSQEEIAREVTAARGRFASAAAFEQELARKYMDETQYRRQLGRQLAIERLLARQVDPAITVTEEDIRQFYEANPQRYASPPKIRLRHILISKSSSGRAPNDDARRRIEMIKRKLDQGEDFAALASRYSEEPTREQGGDLGYVQRGQMLPMIEKTAFDLAVGEVSPILVTENGFHLIQVTDRRAAEVTSLDDARPDIRTTLHQIKRDRAVHDYIASLRRNADIRAAM
jgi:parvulin-like peptidyl-prolyl isomerase